MALTNEDFETILNDESKTIEGDVRWYRDEGHSSAVKLNVKIESDQGWPMTMVGYYNTVTHKLTYAVVAFGVRVYALDFGRHRNPDGEWLDGVHKHRWSEQHRDAYAYVPEDISSPPSEPLAVWSEFLDEAKIRHVGEIDPPPPHQPDPFP